MDLPEEIECKDFSSQDRYKVVMTDKKRENIKAVRKKRGKEIYVPKHDFNSFTER